MSDFLGEELPELQLDLSELEKAAMDIVDGLEPSAGSDGQASSGEEAEAWQSAGDEAGYDYDANAGYEAEGEQLEEDSSSFQSDYRTMALRNVTMMGLEGSGDGFDAGADAFEGGNSSLPSIEIRMATLDDVDDIIDLASEMVKYSRSPFRPVDENVIAEVRRADLQSIYQLLNNKDMVAFVARDHRGRLVGHVLLHIKSGNTDFLTGEELAWVFDISVQPKHWGSGVSRRLLQMAERFAQERGVRYVGLTVTVANGRALRFYQNCGYQEERYQMIKILEPLDMEDDL